MKEYTLKKTRVYLFPAIICILLGAAAALFALTGIKILTVIFAPLSAIFIFLATAFYPEILRVYKITLTEDRLIVHAPKQLSGGETEINWADVKNITFAGKKLFAKSISVNSSTKSAVFPLTAFSNHTDLLKAVIRRSCDNDGFYAEQKVLDMLRNE